MNSKSDFSRRRFLAASAAIPVAGVCLAANQTPKIRIGQIGTKHAHAEGKLQAIRKQSDTYELIGVVEPDQQQKERVRGRDSFRDVQWLTEDELLNTKHLQAVAIETSVNELVPTAIRCLEAGLHLHLDKPAGESLEDCRRMHAIANEKGLTIQMGYMLRYNPAFQFATRIVSDGWLGEITEINGMMGKFMNDAGRKELEQYEGGGMFELACHLIDQVVSFLGRPDEVTAHVRRTFPQKDRFADNQLAVFDYPNAIATIRCNHVDPMGGARRQFSITGTKGTFEIRPLEPKPVGRLGLDQARGEFRRGYQDIDFEKPSGRYDGEFEDLAQVIRGEKKLGWDAEHDIATHETILRASGVL